MLFFSKEGSGRISQLWIVQLDAASWKAWRVQHIKGYYFTEHVICSEWTLCMSANHLKLIYFSFCLTYCIRTSANQVPFISSVINVLPCSEVGLDLELKQLPALQTEMFWRDAEPCGHHFSNVLPSVTPSPSPWEGNQQQGGSKEF